MLKPTKGQIFFYCEDEMECYQVRYITEVEHGCTKFDTTCLEDTQEHFMLIPNDFVTASFEVGEHIVRLDDTTMKRIAKYNLDKEFENINERIKNANNKLKCLNEELEMKKKKLEAMDKLVDMIWKDEDFEEDNYFHKDDEWEEEDY
jgi:hypothetical protein